MARLKTNNFDLSVIKTFNDKVTLDKEYYPEQIEMKHSLDEDFDWAISSMKKSMELVSMQTDWYIVGHPYVGTHLHFQIKKSDWEWFEWTTNCKYQIVDYMYKLLYEWFSKKDMGNEIYRKEVARICMNHNILRYFDQKYMWDRLKANLDNIWFRYPMFHKEGTDRPKYQPIIWSYKTDSGKPHTLELRMIPNTFFYESDWLQLHYKNIFNEVESAINQPKPSLDLVRQQVISIEASHKKLLSLLTNQKKKVEWVYSADDYLAFVRRQGELLRQQRTQEIQQTRVSWTFVNSDWTIRF